MTSRFAATMAALKPAGWWRLGETAGTTTAADSSTYGVSGVYHGAPYLGLKGAIFKDADTAVRFSPGKAGNPYIEIPDHDIYSLAKANDSFHRYGDGWGAADHGGAWTAEVTTSDGYYYCDGLARIRQHTHASWQQGLQSVNPYNADLQVECSWDQLAKGGILAPVALVARRQDNHNFYRAELTENTDHSLDLFLMKTINGVDTVLASIKGIGTYAARDGWFVRFQLEGSILRARAWLSTAVPPKISNQPTSWMITATDTSISKAGNVGIRSSNSTSAARPTVTFSRFWVQTLGLTVHAFLQVGAPFFSGEDYQKYLYWMGKGSHGENEWMFRLYSQDAPAHKGWVSFYTFNLSGGLGAGAAYHADQLGHLLAGKWYQFVGVLDPGDAHDKQAGVRLYLNGVLVDGPSFGGDGSLYSGYAIVPGNGSAPVQLATCNHTSYLNGAIDEVAIFDRCLTPAEILSLHKSAVRPAPGPPRHR
jgi:hypothetical protein